MNYIVKVTEKQKNRYQLPNTPDMLIELNWEIVKYVNSDSLIDINNCLKNLNYPIINDASFFRQHNYEVVYRINDLDYIYLIGTENTMFKQKLRDSILNNIIT